MSHAESPRARFPARAPLWQLRTRSLELPIRPLLMGIVNVTPDSFSDGGAYLSPAAAVAQATRLVEAGADLLDIGGESTRPYAEPISADEELRRLEPVFRALDGKLPVPLSIDTTKPRVAALALAAGFEIVNDISGLADPAMLDLVVASGAGACVMHMQGTPQTMQDRPHYDDLIGEIFEYLRRRRDALESAGIHRQRIALDPGIGFGKTHQHNLNLIAACHGLHVLGCPLLVGHSRKGFIGKVLGDKRADRTWGTVGASLALAAQGVQILRIHDVAAVRQALLLFAAVGGIDGSVLELND